MSPEILFFDLAQASYLPALERLAGRGVTCRFSAPNLREELVRRGLPAGDWLEASDRTTSQRIDAGIAALVERVDAVLSGAAAGQAFGPGEPGFLASRGGDFRADLIALAAGQIEVIEVMADLLATRPPALVVLGGDNSHRQRALIAVCRRAGIPTLKLAHATFARTQQARYPANQLELYADHIAVYGQRSRRDAIALGYPEDRIHVTGAVAWDAHHEGRGRHDPAAARRHFRGDEDPRPEIVFCSCYAEATSCFFPLMHKRALAIYREFGRSLMPFGDGLRVRLRPHPIELGRDPARAALERRRQDAFRDLLRGFGLAAVEVSTLPIEEDFLCADLVISTNGSSTIPLAMSLERPVLAYRWFATEDRTYTEADGVYLAERDCDLGFMVEELLRSPEERARLLERSGPAILDINEGHDGRAGERLAELIFALVDQGATVGASGC